jgi:iron(II)-dependent oxidoreductase
MALVAKTGRHYRVLLLAMTHRYRMGITVAVCLLMAGTVAAQDSQYVAFPWTKQSMIQGPSCLDYPQPWERPWTSCDDETHQRWLADVVRWRNERRIRVGLDNERYVAPALGWTQSAFMQPQAMVEDRYLYNSETQRYTVDRYLGDLEERFGGIDAVLIWPSYPNMGVDDRNQIDMLEAMPGGLAGVKSMVTDFHRRGVRVLFPFMMWDQGARDPGTAWPGALVKLMAQIGADGMNGDTQDGVPLAFSLAAERIGHPLAFEPEGPPHDEALSWNTMSWGQYDFGFVPKVDRFRWLEPRHMVNISDRWARDKADDLQFAFFNGEGWESWENVWGIWNGITARDAEATRRVATIERSVAPFLVSQEWEPFYPMERFGVFASRWPLGGQVVWTIVNRNEYDVDGTQITVAATPGTRWFDLYHGTELKAEVRGGSAVLSFPIEAKGFGAILATQGAPDARIQNLMARMRVMSAAPLTSFDARWRPLGQSIVPIDRTRAYAAAPKGMVPIPAARFDFRVHGVEIEGGDQAGVDVAYPWEEAPRRFHDHVLDIPGFYIDRTLVTNRAFKIFLDATHYRPDDDTNFLKDWAGGTYPAGWDERPVTWVSIEDARAYAKWAGKRLPHEWEWQYAAQGWDGRTYPWGPEWRADAAPVPAAGRAAGPADLTTAHPASASPFGVLDLVGNVWQWTEEFRDAHTRAAILRGGSHYRPQGSLWYFPQAKRNGEHGKLLLMSPGRDRSALIGFRCVADMS